MPTDMVGAICRNLEQSQYSSSSSNGCSSPSMDPRELYRQKSLGVRSILHYDSYSESDESESAFTEFEFQSSLSNASFDATNFSNVIGEESPGGMSVVDGDLSGLQAQFRLDTEEEIEGVDKRSTQHNKLKVAVHGEPSSSHMECRFDQDTGACFLNPGEVILQLGNPRNIRGLNNDTSSYIDSISACGRDPHDLNEPHAVDAEEDFVPSSPTLWGTGLESECAKCSSSDVVVTVDHPKEEPMNERLVNGVRFGCMGSSNKSNVLGFAGMEHEKTPEQTSEVNAEEKKEESSISAFQINPSNSVDEVSLPGNYIKLQQDTSELIIHSIDIGSNLEISDEGSSLSIGSVDLEDKDAQNGLKLKDEEEEEVAQLCPIATSLSSEDKYSNNDKEVNLCDSAVGVSDNDHVIALIKAASEVNEDSDRKRSLSAEFGTSRVVPTSCVDSYTDSGSSYLADAELISLTIPSKPNFGTACDIMSFSASCSGKNDLVLSNQLDSVSGLLNMQCRNNCLNCNPISDCNGSGPKIWGSRDRDTIEEEDQIDASTCDLEVDADDQLNNPIMSILHEDMRVNGLVGEHNMCISTANISENQLEALSFNSQTDGPMKMEIPQEKDTSCHLYDMHYSASIENYAQKSSIEDSDCADILSIPLTELWQANGRESRERIPPPTENVTAEKEVLGLGPCLTGDVRRHEVQTEEMNSSHESRDISSADLETSVQDRAPEVTLTHDPVHNSMTCSRSSSCVEDGIQNHNTPPCSIPACKAEGEICAREDSDVNNHGHALIAKENKEADDNGKIEKEPEVCKEELVPELNHVEKPKKRAKGKRVLKSVAGAMALIGALFLICHIRQKREKEKSIESISQQQTHKPAQELPEQKRVDTAKTAGLYPGERLKF